MELHLFKKGLNEYKWVATLLKVNFCCWEAMLLKKEHQQFSIIATRKLVWLLFDFQSF